MKKAVLLIIIVVFLLIYFSLNNNNNKNSLHYAICFSESKTLKKIKTLVEKNNVDINHNMNGTYIYSTLFIKTSTFPFFSKNKVFCPGTPLHQIFLNKEFHRTKKESNEIIKFLLESGAKVNIKDCYGRTPLDLLTKRPIDKDILQLMLEKGANPYTLHLIGKKDCLMYSLPIFNLINNDEIEAIKIILNFDSKTINEIICMKGILKEQTLLDYIINEKKKNLITLFRKYGAKTLKELNTNKNQL